MNSEDNIQKNNSETRASGHFYDNEFNISYDNELFEQLTGKSMSKMSAVEKRIEIVQDTMDWIKADKDLFFKK